MASSTMLLGCRNKFATRTCSRTATRMYCLPSFEYWRSGRWNQQRGCWKLFCCLLSLCRGSWMSAWCCCSHFLSSLRYRRRFLTLSVQRVRPRCPSLPGMGSVRCALAGDITVELRWNFLHMGEALGILLRIGITDHIRWHPGLRF